MNYTKDFKFAFEELQKAIRDRSHLVPKQITDKNGHKKTVFVRPGENPVSNKGKKPAPETTEKTPAKPKYEVGSMVSLDGIKGDYKVLSIDKDGTYHVVSANGKRGFKVSENHINQEGTKNLAEKKKMNDEIDSIDFDKLNNDVSNKKKEKDPEMDSNNAENNQDKKMAKVQKWDDLIKQASNSDEKTQQKVAEQIEKEYEEIKKQKLTDDETDFVEFYHDKAQKWLGGGVPKDNVAPREMPSGYIAGLDEKTQNQLYDALKEHFKGQGMGRFEAAEAAQNAMDSKVSDLQDVWNENQKVKTILWNANK